MRQLLEAALEVTRKGETVALATIVRAQGSTPRATGSKMLVFRDGTIKGTIGGGEMEGRVIQEALAAIEAGQPRMTHYTYRETEEGGVGICGGGNCREHRRPDHCGDARQGLRCQADCRPSYALAAADAASAKTFQDIVG